ncbi:zinc-binding dehydrogenase [Phytomonospora sp. NPDC050363]|uniref:alcohol dehydrogenase catalytic domain-containing protein n=1 Tax=Phytomonospora sp. NPDC050363 TaxID=3155642 RepID=UPI0033D4EDAE
MRAVRLHEYGPVENLRLEEVPDPVPGAGQVRVAVTASGMQLLETWLRQGRRVGPHPAPPLPAVLGGEIAGVVDAVGEGVDGRWLGRRVTASIEGGGYAELALAELGDLHPLPDGLGEAEAVAMISTGVTALAVWDLADAGPGDVVLVTAAAGGIGGILLQVAKAAGATVIGLAGGETKTRLVRDAGADLAIDYLAPGWPGGIEGKVTVALDGVGGEIAQKAWNLADKGVSFGAAADSGDISRPLPPHVTSLFTSPLMAEFGDPEGLRRHVDRALRTAADGDIRPAVTTFALADTAAAQRALANRETTGKVVLLP